MPPSPTCQVLITGAGIAGLWTLRRLLAEGYDALLLEQSAIGSGQTLGAQGILHGGVKYGLDGSSRAIADRLRAQPPRWLDALAGQGELDLSAASINSPCQHLWAADSWLARVGATVGSRAMQGEVKRLDPADWPDALRSGGHRGSVYELAETVLDVRSVCTALAAPVRDRIFTAAIDSIEAHNGHVASLRCGNLSLTASAYLFMAATGNESAASALGMGPEATQRRPLRMIMVRGRLPRLFGHCVTVSPKPIVTITSHTMAAETVWYLGGGIAEDAATLSETDAIGHAAAVMARVFPAMNWHGLQWASWQVDRAEPNAASRLPDGPALRTSSNAAVGWPSKLVYAPALADLAASFAGQLCAPSGSTSQLPMPPAPIGSYPWETSSWHSL
jgi:glycine/D-amino acid oxidase-like deaminating enzyme